MITEKPFNFNVQLFAVPEVATISAAGGNVQINGSTETETYTFSESVASSSANAAEIASETITADTSAITTLASGSWIKGGGLSSDQLSLNGIADIKNFESADVVQLSAAGNNLSLTAVEGSVEIENLHNNTLAQNINGAAVNATFEESTAATINGENNGVEIAAEGNVTLNTIDENQTWNIAADKAVNFGGVEISTDADISVEKSSEDEILNITANSAALEISANNANVDGVEINGAVLTGMQALNGANINAANTEIQAENLNGGAISVDDWNLTLSADDSFTYDNVDENLEINSNFENAVTIEGAADAELTLTNSAESINAAVNGANINVTNDSDGVAVVLEDGGISAINGIASGALVTISGDNSFNINDKFDVETSGDFEAMIGSSAIITEVDNGGNINISGGNAVYGVASGQATLNGERVTLSSSSNGIFTMTDEDITDIFLNVGDTLSTASDKVFTVTYDASEVVDENQYVLAVNDTSITLDGSDFAGDTLKLDFLENGTVKIEGLATGTSIKATAGTYKVGNHSAVTVSETSGYINIDANGKPSVSSESVEDEETKRAAEISAIESAQNTVPALDAYTNLNDLPAAVRNSTVAGYANASTDTPVAESVEGGINISVDNEKQKEAANLGDTDKLRHVKLTSAVSSDIVIAEPEGDSIYSSVIDVSGSTRNTLIAVGTGNENSYVNHTIIGSSRDGETIIFLGDKLKGKNYVQAGDGGASLYNGGANATLKGGAGADSIYAGGGDYVEGGKGADLFFDSNDMDNSGGYTVGDFSIEDGDVIVATNYSKDNIVSSSDFKVKNGAVAISGGNYISLASGENQVVFTDAANSKERKLMWANTYGGEIDASNVFSSDTGVIIVADQNGNRGDTITGSVKSDTIFAAGNDVIYGGDGRDKIYLSAAEGNEFGAIVDLTSKTTNTKEINDWSFGFDKSDNMIFGDPNQFKYHVTQNDNLQVSSDNGSLILIADDNASRDRFDFLIGDSKYNPAKVSVVKDRVNSTFESNDELADIYIAAGEHSTITFGEDVTEKFTFSNEEGADYNFNYVALYNNSNATMNGTSANEEVSLGGGAANHATKTVSLGGGNDTVYSGGVDTAVTGNIIQFGTNDGEDVIYNFGYYQGKKADVQQKGADVVEISGWDYAGGTSSIKVTENNIALSVASGNVLNIEGEVDADNMAILNLDGEEQIAKFGLSNNKHGNEFTYNKEVDAYYGDVTNNNDKLTVEDSTSSAEIYLDGSNGVQYYGINEVDASAAKRKVILFGNDSDNVLTSGGANATLWGGDSASNDELIGSSARDTFLFGANGGNDTVSNFENGMDKVKLLDTSLTEIVGAFEGDNAISITLTDGSKLTVESEGSMDGATFQFSEGTYKAQKQDDGSINWK